MAFIDQREVKVAWSDEENVPKGDHYFDPGRPGLFLFHLMEKERAMRR